MSLALVHSRARAGSMPRWCGWKCTSGGLPATQIVGLAETSVRESRERVRAALLCARFDFPQRRITLNLAPADLPRKAVATTWRLPWAFLRPVARLIRSRCCSTSSWASWG